MRYKTVSVDGIEVFYREAGDRSKPTIVLLHGFPTSSHMFRNLMPQLATQFHVVAPDLPGFGFTESPPLDAFTYTFDKLAEVMQAWLTVLGLERYFLYVMDYGAPVGFRLASAAPEKIAGLIVQNGNAYEEGLTEAWAPIRAYWQDKSDNTEVPLQELLTPEFTRLQYVNGVQQEDKISPDCWAMDCAFFNDPLRKKIQLALFYDYRNNLASYADWQAYFRQHQPATLLVWGVNDLFFSREGAECYARDLQNLESHYFDTGHFALEDHAEEIADLMRRFVEQQVG